jgi:hypothetical protein
MEKDRASVAWHWRIRVVPNLDEPAISEITQAHLCFFVPAGRILGVDFDVLVVVRIVHVIDPRVSRSHSVEWVLGTGRQ